MNGTPPQDPRSQPADNDNEPTAVFPTYGRGQQTQQRLYGEPYPQYGPNPASSHPYAGDTGEFGSPTPPVTEPPKRRRGAGIVTAAVLAGALAGVAGAAGYSALVEPTQEATTSVPAASSPSSVVADTDAPAGSVEAVAEAVLPSVVKIDVAGPGGQGSGSGIILTSDGTIVTNNHVVAAAGESGDIAVSFNDGSTTTAEIVGTDPVTDIAVIKAEDVSGLTPATLGSSDAVEVGQEVVAVGSPFGLESTVTSGIVSALDRPVTTSDGEQRNSFPAIQTDAAINPGNSGGALVNMQGKVIGINTAIRSTASVDGEAGSIGLGFAIPIDEAKPITEQLIAGDVATHARLGVGVQTPANQEGLPGGAEISSVEPGSGAAEAGLEEGDVIIKVDDQVISTSDGLVAMVRSYRPGDKVNLTILRDDEQQQVTVTLGSDEGDDNT
jgi:putative serine protease PepD